MAFTCGFFNSVNGDRKYNSRQISQIFDGIITDGVFGHYGTHFNISPIGNMGINVGSGRFWFNHVWGLNDGNLTITLNPADIANDRIDAVIIDIDESDSVRNAFVTFVTGTPSAGKPAMISTSTRHQYPLAYVTVKADSTSISAANIQVVVGTSQCPFVTSVLDSVSVDNLFSQWDAQFTEWFSGIQATLDDNIVTNLINQINNLQQTKASKTELATVENKIGTYLMVNGNKIKPEVISSPDSEMYINDLVNGQGILNLNKYGYSYYANIYKVEFLPNGSNYNVTALIHIYRIFSKKITLMKALSVVLYSTSSSSGTVTLSTPISSYLRYWPGRSDVAILRVNISFTSGGSESIRLVLKIDNGDPFGCTVNDDYFYGFIGYYQNWDRYLYRIRNYSNYFEIYKHDVHGRNYGPSLGNVFQLPNTKVIENTAGSVDPMSVITWETNSVKIYKFTDPSENTDSVSTLSFTQRIIYSHTYNYSSGPYARCVLARHNECLLADTQNNKLYYIDSSNIMSTSFRHSYNHICIGFNSFIYYILEVNGEQYYLDIYKVTNGQISNVTYLSIGSNLGTFSNNFFNATTAINFESGDYITLIQTSKNIIFLKINGTTASVLRIVSLEKIYMLSNNSKFTNIQAIYKPNTYSVGSIVTIPNSNAQSMTIYDDSPVKMNNRFKIQTFSV